QARPAKYPPPRSRAQTAAPRVVFRRIVASKSGIGPNNGSTSRASSSQDATPSGVPPLTVLTRTSWPAIEEPGVHIDDVTFPQGVPFFFEEPGFDAGDVRGQPLTVTERHGLVLAAVQHQHRNRYLGYVKAPRGHLRHAVVPGSFDPGAMACWIETASSVSSARSQPGIRACKSRAT